MTAVDLDALDKLRGALAAWLAARDSQEGILASWHDDADAILAGPLAPLVAEARKYRALRESVEQLAGALQSEAESFPYVLAGMAQGPDLLTAKALERCSDRLRAAMADPT